MNNLIFISILKGNELTLVKLNVEKVKFIKIINSDHFDAKSTTKFWKEQMKELPTLSRLAFILLNIPSSSAFIERFYSICGNVCKRECGNMTPETIIQRSFLKANTKFLENLSGLNNKL